MSLQQIKDRRGKIDGAPWSYFKPAQNIIGKSLGGCNKEMSEYRVADIRGWGHLQYMGIERGDKVAQDMQDANGIFIAAAPDDVDFLLAEIERLRILLLTANRYVEGYAENENNHPQARDCASDLVRQIKEKI